MLLLALSTQILDVMAADLPSAVVFPDARSLWVQSMTGDVSVVGGGDAVSVMATPGQWDAGCDLAVSEGALAHLEVERRRRRLRCELALQVTLPADVRLRLELAQGAVALSSVQSPTDILLTQGDLRLEDQTGSLYARVEQGNITGHLDNASLSAVVGTGEVSVQYATAPHRPIQVSVVEGSVEVRLPPETPVQAVVEASAAAECALPQTEDAPTRVQLRVRRGSARLLGNSSGL